MLSKHISPGKDQISKKNRDRHPPTSSHDYQKYDGIIETGFQTRKALSSHANATMKLNARTTFHREQALRLTIVVLPPDQWTAQ